VAYGGRGYRGDYGGGGYRGDSIFSKIAKGVGGIAKAVFRASPVGQVVGGIASVLTSSRAAAAAPAAPAPMRPMAAMPGTAVATQGRVSPLGTVGMCPAEIVYTRSGQARKYRMKKDGGCTWHKRPTMNVMNPRAASKAVTRIKGARDLLARIERTLPKAKQRGHAVKGKCGCK